jgi:hypothetical protein
MNATHMPPVLASSEHDSEGYLVGMIYDSAPSLPAPAAEFFRNPDLRNPKGD